MPGDNSGPESGYGLGSITSVSASIRTPLAIVSSSNFNRSSNLQAKRTLETQLADTERRIQDASRLGTALLGQKQDLVARLKEVESQRDEDELGPELRQKLVELERDYNEVGKETARVLVPRSRKISQETLDVTNSYAQGSANDGRISPTRNASLSRRPGNVLSGRVNDIQFATDISASLLGQVRSLQALLAEREETIKTLKGEKVGLQAELESFGQKIRGLDDSEQRYRDENWGLETQVQDLTTQLKDLQNREQRLNQALNLARAEQLTSEKELDDIKQVHNKLTDEHVELSRQHDVESTGLRRNLTMAQAERDDLLHKVSELTAHNKEMANAISEKSASVDRDDVQSDNMIPSLRDSERSSPEHSPPPSPSKNTPRPGALESETLKSSLQHAHRMIQNLKTNIHREKTEKLELKRLLQDARDEVEVRRSDGGGLAATMKKRKTAESSRKAAKADKLGGPKLPKEELLDDSPWEDHEGNASLSGHVTPRKQDESTQDTSDAFETAHEKDSTTETEAFHTGAESLAGDSTDELTETENSHAARLRPGLSQSRDRTSFLSTASEEAEKTPVETPRHQSKYRIRMTRSGVRRDVGSPQTARDSPASFRSSESPAQTGQTLASELEDLDDASIANSTPTRPLTSMMHTPPSGKPRSMTAGNSVDDDESNLENLERPADLEQAPGNLKGGETAPSAGFGVGMLATTVRGIFGARNGKENLMGGEAVQSRRVPDLLNTATHQSSETTGGMLSMSAIISQQTAPTLQPAPSALASSHPLPEGSRYGQHLIADDETLASSFGLDGVSISQPTATKHDTSSMESRLKAKSSGDEDRLDSSLRDRHVKSEMALMMDEGTQTSAQADTPNSLVAENDDIRGTPSLSLASASGSPIPKSGSSRQRLSAAQAARSTDGSLSQPNNVRRPLSSGSARKIAAPPLPIDHKEAIAAASKSNLLPSLNGNLPVTTMAPKNQNAAIRPRTPASLSTQSPGLNKASASTSRRPTSASGSRRSSISSFTSEIDERIEVHGGRSAQLFDGFEMRNADPRMIQAITQTMIGEFLWKYTRKAGRGEHSDNRHRRFFWIHPYTRTLYWSNQDPSTTGRAELKAKSVGIEAVRVVSDDNPMPPGLHPKSIVVVTPGRSIKFTAPTSQRHETWFNALSYLLLRTGQDRREDGSLQTRPHATHSNLNFTRLHRNNSTQSRYSEDVPDYVHGDTTTTSANRLQASSPGQAESFGTPARTTQHSPSYGLERPEVFKRPALPNTSRYLSKEPGPFRNSSIASKLRPQSGLFGIKKDPTSRSSYSAATSASQSGRQSRSESLERRPERSSLENVRACCDGKHDVGSLTHRPSRHASISSRSGLQRQQASSANSSAQHLPADPAGYMT